MRPLRNNIIVKRLVAETKSAGGIILTDTAIEVPNEGVVVACGSGLFEGGERVPLEVEVGQVVLFPAFAGTLIPVDGEPHLIMLDSDVLAVSEEAR